MSKVLGKIKTPGYWRVQMIMHGNDKIVMREGCDTAIHVYDV